MATTAGPAPRHSDTSTVDQLLIVSEATPLELNRVSAPVRRPNVLVRLAESPVALNDWLSGPAMSKRDSFTGTLPRRTTKGLFWPSIIGGHSAAAHGLETVMCLEWYG